MNKKTQKVAALSLAALVGTGVFATTVDAASLTKNLKATYNNIRVSYNGDLVTPTKEPFTIDGTVYVSLRDAGQITGNSVTWGNNTVQITSSGTTSSTDQLTIMQKDLQIATLTAQLTDAQNKIKQLEGSGSNSNSGTSGNTSSSTITKTLKLIEDEYADYKKVDWDFDLTEKSNKLYLTVSYASRYDKSDFANISNGTLEKFLKDICSDIAYELGDREIRGELIDDTKDEVYSTFTYSTSGKFTNSKEYSKTALRDLQDELESDYKRLPNIAYGALDKADIAVQDIYLTQSNDYETISFDIDIDLTTDQKNSWNQLSGGSSTRDLEYFLEDICEDIEYEFNNVEEVNGYIKCDGTLILKYEDGILRFQTAK